MFYEWIWSKHYKWKVDLQKHRIYGFWFWLYTRIVAIKTIWKHLRRRNFSLMRSWIVWILKRH